MFAIMGRDAHYCNISNRIFRKEELLGYIDEVNQEVNKTIVNFKRSKIKQN
jgi:hypothetical protein